jgi:uncharacterized protein (TIGR03083 family)
MTLEKATLTRGEDGDGVDLGLWYRDARQRICLLVNEDVAGLAVPATPEWDVHDVVAHLAGVATDAVSGNLDGVTTNPWTAAQVERGRGRAIAELVAEWEAGSPLVESFLTAAGRGPAEGAVTASRGVLDVCTHEADLQGALGRPLGLPPEVLTWAAALLRASFHEGVASAGLPPVEIVATELDWFRGRLGRRTEAEVCALGWSRQPEPYLDIWFVFGRALESLGEQPV